MSSETSSLDDETREERIRRRFEEEVARRKARDAQAGRLGRLVYRASDALKSLYWLAAFAIVVLLLLGAVIWVLWAVWEPLAGMLIAVVLIGGIALGVRRNR